MNAECLRTCRYKSKKARGSNAEKAGDAVTSLQFKFEQHLHAPPAVNERCRRQHEDSRRVQPDSLFWIGCVFQEPEEPGAVRLGARLGAVETDAILTAGFQSVAQLQQQFPLMLSIFFPLATHYHVHAHVNVDVLVVVLYRLVANSNCGQSKQEKGFRGADCMRTALGRETSFEASEQPLHPLH